ncbi:hypothetical protein ACVWY2_003492 [Bradyrhizobium sp. JR6.1]
MAEITRTHSGGDDQEVVIEFLAANAWARDLDGTCAEIDALDLRQQHAEVLLFRLELADRGRDLGGRQNSRGDLVQQRLKDMVIAPVDQRDLDVGAF